MGMTETDSAPLKIFPHNNHNTDNTPKYRDASPLKPNNMSKSKKSRTAKNKENTSKSTIFKSASPTQNNIQTDTFIQNKKTRTESKIKNNNNPSDDEFVSNETNYLSFKHDPKEEESSPSISNSINSGNDSLKSGDSLFYEEVSLSDDSSSINKINKDIKATDLERVDVCEAGNLINNSNTNNTINITDNKNERDILKHTSDKDRTNKNGKIMSSTKNNRNNNVMKNEIKSVELTFDKNEEESPFNTQIKDKDIPHTSNIDLNKKLDTNKKLDLKKDIIFYETYLKEPVFTEKEQVEDGTSLFRSHHKMNNGKKSRRAFFIFLFVLILLCGLGAYGLYYLYQEK